jgi:hypothetical protein
MANEKSYGLNGFQGASNLPQSQFYQSVFTDAIDSYGIDVFYLPLADFNNDTTQTGHVYNDDNIDAIWGEIRTRKYDKTFGMRMIAEDMMQLGGQGDMFSKFGLQVFDDMTLFITRKEFQERITGEEIDLFDGQNLTVNEDTHDMALGTVSPKVGDLVFIPMWKESVYEITHVEDEEYMILGHRAFWKLIVKKYIVSPEEYIDITDTTDDNAAENNENTLSVADVVNTINDLDDRQRDKVNSFETDTTQTGFVENKKDDIVNDNVSVEAPTIVDPDEINFLDDW